MPLPADPRTPWPPPHLQGELADIAEAASWYSSSMDQLRGHAANTVGRQLPQAADEPQQGHANRLGTRGKFWQRRSTDRAPNRQQYHVPLAADIAGVSADLVVGAEPKITVDNDATQARLDELMAEAGLHNALLEAFEVCAALGGVWLAPAWDPDLADHPLPATIHPDAAVPEWRSGMLSAVTFWSTVHVEGNGEKAGTVWRHLTRHEPGVILHALYAGTKDSLGVQRPLDAMPGTAELDDEIPLPFDGLAPRYIPNVRPNRKRRRSMQGRSDFQGSYDLLDALDEAYSSWMRDLRLGQARIIAAEAALERGSGRGQGTYFDPDREVYAGLDIDPNDRTLIEPVQFAIRVEQHERTVSNLIERIVSAAGYAPQTFGLHIEGRAEAGTALRVREAKTLRTRDRKQGYATKPVAEVIENLLAIDAAEFASGVVPERPTVQWGSALVDDPREQAETLRMLSEARAASVEQRVKMAQPELEGDALAEEVKAVRQEFGLGPLADPEGGMV